MREIVNRLSRVIDIRFELEIYAKLGKLIQNINIIKDEERR